MHIAKQRARTVLAVALNVPADDIPDNAGIKSFPRWDSLGHVRVIMELEKALGRTLQTEEILSIADLDSIQDIFDRA